MKICIVPTMFPKYRGDYYGSFVFDEAKTLVDKGFEVHVVTQHNQNTPYEEIVEGIHVHRFRWLEPRKFRALVHFRGVIDSIRLLTYVIALFFKLIRVIFKYKINIIHAHSTIPTGFLAVIISKIFRIPSFVTAHGMDVNNFENSLIFKRIISYTLNNCYKTIAVSDDLADKMEQLGVDENKILVLRNAVDINRFKPINGKSFLKDEVEENEVVILFVGYLDTFKGIFELIDAFFKIYKENKSIKLLIVGTGPKHKELKRKVSELELDNSVIFTGKVAHGDIHQYYQAADIFVLPSYSEGLPLSILEAMASNTSVIAGNVGGIPEIIEDGKNGFIVPPKDIEVLIEKLNILIFNTKLRESFAKNSLKMVQNNFDINKKTNSLIKFYIDAIHVKDEKFDYD